MMQPTSLRYFHQVARLGSIRRAAEYLNVAASAVSRQVSLLEHEVGQPLIQRLSRGVKLTDAGEVVASHLRDMESDHRLMLGKLDEIKGGQRGHMKIAMIEGVIAHFLPQVLDGFHATAPHVRVDVCVVGSARAAEMLRVDDCDLAIVFESNDLTGLTIDAELTDPFCAIMPPTHALATRDSVRLADIEPYPVVLNDRSYATRNLVDKAAGEAGVSLRMVAEINSIEGAKALARVGFGIAFLPAFAIALERSRHELVGIRLLDKPFVGSRLLLVTRQNRRLPIACELFRRRLVSAFRDPAAFAIPAHDRRQKRGSAAAAETR